MTLIKTCGANGMINSKLTCASFFTGVGGIDFAFEKTGFFKTIYANEFDRYPVSTYELNFDTKVDCRSICDVLPDDVPDFDVCLAGFPCQAFSIAGKRQGFNDTKGRGTLFFEVARIIAQKRPKIVFFENVKNLVSHDNGCTLATILDMLSSLGYYVTYKVLNAMLYGNIPQNRERVYIVGFRDKTVYDKFCFPDTIPLTTKLSDIINFDIKVENKYYYTKGKYNGPDGDIYDIFIRCMTDKNTVYQWRRSYVRANKSGVVPTLTATMGMGGHNVPIVLTDYGIRKLTPRECFNAQGFPVDFKLPAISDSRLYKQAGNSVCISVIERIAENIAKSLN